MKNFRKITKYVIENDDYLFFLKLPFISANPFWISIQKILELQSFTGPVRKFIPEKKNRLIVGRTHYLHDLIYSQLDQNPLVLFLLQNPLDHILENYWCLAFNIQSNHHQKKTNQHALFSMEEFLENPEYRRYIDNPQWHALLNLNLAWSSKEKLDLLSPEAKYKLIWERLDQAAFFGLVEHYSLSFDLFQYTFTGNIDRKLYTPSPPKIGIFSSDYPNELVTHKILSQIKKRTQKDLMLYQDATRIFFTRYRQMTRRLIKTSDPFKSNNYLLGTRTDPMLTPSEIRLIHLIRKFKNLFKG